MLPKFFIAAGACLIAAKAWYDHLPLWRKVKVGDRVTVQASDLVNLPSPLSPQADIQLEVLSLGLDDSFLGKAVGVRTPDGGETPLPPSSVYAALQCPREKIRSAMRKGADGVYRPVA